MVPHTVDSIARLHNMLGHLLELGVDLNATDTGGATVLFPAVCTIDVEPVSCHFYYVLLAIRVFKESHLLA